MAVTVQQLLSDAKRLVTRLREHDNSADALISQAQKLNNNLEIMKEHHEELEQLNGLAHQRPRSALILNIQQENRHIRELQQENRELRTMLEEHQSAIDLIMNKYRQQTIKLMQTRQLEKTYAQKDNSQETSQTVSSGFRQEWYRWKALVMRIKKCIGTTRPNPTVQEIQELQKRAEKLSEMAAVMQKAIEIDDENYAKERKMLQRLTNENKLLRDLLEISKSRQIGLAHKLKLERTDEGVQTDL